MALLLLMLNIAVAAAEAFVQRSCGGGGGRTAIVDFDGGNVARRRCRRGSSSHVGRRRLCRTASFRWIDTTTTTMAAGDCCCWGKAGAVAQRSIPRGRCGVERSGVDVGGAFDRQKGLRRPRPNPPKLSLFLNDDEGGHEKEEGPNGGIGGGESIWGRWGALRPATTNKITRRRGGDEEESTTTTSTTLPAAASAAAAVSATNEKKRNAKVDADEMARLEREVTESVRAKMDAKRIADPFLSSPSVDLDGTASSASVPPGGKGGEEEEEDTLLVSTAAAASTMQQTPWKIALAAGSTVAALSFVALHNSVVSIVSFVLAFVAASQDPFDEEGATGALARVVGRATLRSIETTQPKVRAVARAAVNGDDELVRLRRRLAEVEAENDEMRRWIHRRNAVDAALPRYSLVELKGLARERGLTVGGTKAQLLMRLCEEGVVDLTNTD